MRSFFILTVVGKDRPGIVADVTEILYKWGCNLEDSSMSLLGRHFALLVLLSGEGEGLNERLQSECQRLTSKKNLIAFCSPLHEMETPMPVRRPEPDYEIRLVGRDRAGIVYNTSKMLASQGINIVDLRTHLSPAPKGDENVFTMIMGVTVPESIHRRQLREMLEDLSEELDVEISLTKLPRP
jgi:glycine cleavage system transcriptional repressor